MSRWPCPSPACTWGLLLLPGLAKPNPCLRPSCPCYTALQALLYLHPSISQPLQAQLHRGGGRRGAVDGRHAAAAGGGPGCAAGFPGGAILCVLCWVLPAGPLGPFWA